jgi:hypothetical protein
MTLVKRGFLVQSQRHLHCPSTRVLLHRIAGKRRSGPENIKGQKMAH